MIEMIEMIEEHYVDMLWYMLVLQSIVAVYQLRKVEALIYDKKQSAVEVSKLKSQLSLANKKCDKILSGSRRW